MVFRKFLTREAFKGVDLTVSRAFSASKASRKQFLKIL